MNISRLSVQKRLNIYPNTYEEYRVILNGHHIQIYDFFPKGCPLHKAQFTLRFLKEGGRIGITINDFLYLLTILIYHS